MSNSTANNVSLLKQMASLFNIKDEGNYTSDVVNGKAFITDYSWSSTGSAGNMIFFNAQPETQILTGNVIANTPIRFRFKFNTLPGVIKDVKIVYNLQETGLANSVVPASALSIFQYVRLYFNANTSVIFQQILQEDIFKQFCLLPYDKRQQLANLNFLGCDPNTLVNNVTIPPGGNANFQCPLPPTFAYLNRSTTNFSGDQVIDVIPILGGGVSTGTGLLRWGNNPIQLQMTIQRNFREDANNIATEISNIYRDYFLNSQLYTVTLPINANAVQSYPLTGISALTAGVVVMFRSDGGSNTCSNAGNVTLYNIGGTTTSAQNISCQTAYLDIWNSSGTSIFNQQLYNGNLLSSLPSLIFPSYVFNNVAFYWIPFSSDYAKSNDELARCRGCYYFQGTEILKIYASSNWVNQEYDISFIVETYQAYDIVPGIVDGTNEVILVQ